MTAALQIPLLSVEDYLAFETQATERHEYVGGYVYAMAGARTKHDRIAGAFYAHAHQQLRHETCEPFTSDMKLRIRYPTYTRFYYPDGMIVCEPNDPDDPYQDRPVVVAEVISESTRRTDEVEKLEA